jgi:hypothetical protein
VGLAETVGLAAPGLASITGLAEGGWTAAVAVQAVIVTASVMNSEATGRFERNGCPPAVLAACRAIARHAEALPPPSERTLYCDSTRHARD